MKAIKLILIALATTFTLVGCSNKQPTIAVEREIVEYAPYPFDTMSLEGVFIYPEEYTMVNTALEIEYDKDGKFTGLMVRSRGGNEPTYYIVVEKDKVTLSAKLIQRAGINTFHKIEKMNNIRYYYLFDQVMDYKDKHKPKGVE